LTSSSRGRPTAPVLALSGTVDLLVIGQRRSGLRHGCGDQDEQGCGHISRASCCRTARHRYPLRDNCGRLRAWAARLWGEPAVGASGTPPSPASIGRTQFTSGQLRALVRGLWRLVAPRIVPRGFRGCPETARRPRWGLGQDGRSPRMLDAERVRQSRHARRAIGSPRADCRSVSSYLTRSLAVRAVDTNPGSSGCCSPRASMIRSFGMALP